VYDELTRLARNIIGAIADQPKRLIIAIALGFTLKATSQVLIINVNTPSLIALRDLDTYYYIAIAFVFVFAVESYVSLLRRQDRELAAIEREISVLSKAMGNSNLTPETQRAIWRRVTRRLANRVTGDRDTAADLALTPDA
jgi:hypothetical protein